MNEDKSLSSLLHLLLSISVSLSHCLFSVRPFKFKPKTNKRRIDKQRLVRQNKNRRLRLFLFDEEQQARFYRRQNRMNEAGSAQRKGIGIRDGLDVASLCCLLKFGCLTCLSTAINQCHAMSCYVTSHDERRHGMVLVYFCVLMSAFAYLRLTAKIPYVLLLRLLATVRYCNRYFYLKYTLRSLFYYYWHVFSFTLLFFVLSK